MIGGFSRKYTFPRIILAFMYILASLHKKYIVSDILIPWIPEQIRTTENGCRFVGIFVVLGSGKAFCKFGIVGIRYRKSTSCFQGFREQFSKKVKTDEKGQFSEQIDDTKSVSTYGRFMKGCGRVCLYSERITTTLGLSRTKQKFRINQCRENICFSKGITEISKSRVVGSEWGLEISQGILWKKTGVSIGGGDFSEIWKAIKKRWITIQFETTKPS